jgi:hypothetical protein
VFALAMIVSIVGFVAGAVLVVSGARAGLGRAHARGSVLRRRLILGLAVAVAAGVTPHFYEELGIAGPLLLAAGFGAHTLVERRRRAPMHFASVLLVPVLATHAALDGATIALVSRAGGGVAPALLSVPVALHRVPEGMLLAGILLPRAGVRLTLAAAFAIAGATLGGGMIGGALLDALREWERAPLQAIVAVGVGALLSVLAHRSAHAHG